MALRRTPPMDTEHQLSDHTAQMERDGEQLACERPSYAAEIERARGKSLAQEAMERMGGIADEIERARGRSLAQEAMQRKSLAQEAMERMGGIADEIERARGKSLAQEAMQRKSLAQEAMEGRSLVQEAMERMGGIADEIERARGKSLAQEAMQRRSLAQEVMEGRSLAQEAMERMGGIAVEIERTQQRAAREQMPSFVPRASYTIGELHRVEYSSPRPPQPRTIKLAYYDDRAWTPREMEVIRDRVQSELSEKNTSPTGCDCNPSDVVVYKVQNQLHGEQILTTIKFRCRCDRMGELAEWAELRDAVRGLTVIQGGDEHGTELRDASSVLTVIRGGDDPGTED
jgi:O-acetyl-ADP-ribose deacetylase (regulator of RNase III)